MAAATKPLHLTTYKPTLPRRPGFRQHVVPALGTQALERVHNLRQLLDLLKNPAFLEKLTLLLVTAALTGFMIPQLAARLADARYREQKVFEAELQRQKDILSAQSELLKRLAKLLWEFQLLNIDVSFYKTNGNEDGFRKALEKYQNNAAELLGQIRAELSTSRRLASPIMQQKLLKLYFGTLLKIDARLEQLVAQGSNSSQQEWREQHDASFGAAQEEIDEVLTELAIEFRLTAPAVNNKGI